MITCLLTTSVMAGSSSDITSNAQTTTENDTFASICIIEDDVTPTASTTPKSYLYETEEITTIDICDCYDIETKTLHLNISDVTEPSGVTTEHIKDFIAKRTKWAGMEDYIVSLDNEINVIFLLAVARIETGAGEACVGDYNCFNIKGKDGKYCNYNSYEESIDHFVRLITNQYIDSDGMWHEGTGIRDIAINYCDHHWGEVVVDLSNEIKSICDDAINPVSL